MKRYQRFLALVMVLALTLSLSVVPSARAAEETGKWYDQTMSVWASRGVIQGDEEGNLKPLSNITRAEMAVILDRIMGYQAKAEEGAFTDVKAGDWFADAVLGASAAGVLQGDGAAARPLSLITRQEAAVMLCRVMGLDTAQAKDAGFSDGGDVAPWAAAAVNAMAEKGYIQGYGGAFRPLDPITRAEALTILSNMFSSLYAKAGTYETDAAGSAVVSAGNVTLSGLKVAGDLIVAEGVAAGQVVLDGVTVGGRLIVRGGASVVVKGASKVDAVLAARLDGKVELTVEGAAKVGALTVYAGDKGVKLTGDAAGVNVTGAKAAVEIAGSVKKLDVAATAEGAVITVDRGGAVDTLTTAANGLKVDGPGRISTMTVTAGADVKVSEDTTVTKLINNCDNVVLLGKKEIKPGATGSSTITGGGGSAPSLPEGAPAHDIGTLAKFVEEARKAQKTIDVSLKQENDALATDVASITNNDATTMTIDFGATPVGDVTIRSTSAAAITLKGTGSFASLTVYAPYAHVENNVAVLGGVTIEAVSDSTFLLKAKAAQVVMAGSGRLDIDPVKAGDTPVVVDTDKAVTLTGNITGVTVTRDASVTVSGIARGAVPAIDGQTPNAALTVEADKVILSGQMGSLSINKENAEVELHASSYVGQVTAKTAATVTGGGYAEKVEAQAPVTLNAFVGQVEVPAAATEGITIGGTANVGTVTVNNAGVKLEVSADKVVVRQAASVEVGAGQVVNVVETAKDVTIGGTGAVHTVDVSGATASKPVTVTVSPETQVAGVGAVDGDPAHVVVRADQEIGVYAKHSAPAGLTVTAPAAIGGQGRINGLMTAMEYAKLDSGDTWSEFKPCTAGSMDLDAGAYLVRTAETGGNEDYVGPSEAVYLEIPAAVGVSAAKIEGIDRDHPRVGETMWAQADDTATGRLSYTWRAGDTVLGSGESYTLTANEVGKTITVTIGNYGAAGTTSAATGKVLADRNGLRDALGMADRAQKGVAVVENGTPATVPLGVVFVTRAEDDALRAKIAAAAAVEQNDDAAQAQVNTAAAELRAAVDAYLAAKETGQYDDVQALQDAIGSTVTDAAAVKNDANLMVSADNGLDVAPDKPWVTQAAKDALDAAIATAEAGRGSTDPQALGKTLSDLNLAIVKFQSGIRNGADIDTGALDRAIENAEANEAATKTAAGEALPNEKWAADSARNAYTAAISAAKAVQSAPGTQRAVLTAISALTASTNTFNAAKQDGTKDVVAPVLSGVSAVRAGEAAAAVTFTTNEAGKYTYGFAEAGGQKPTLGNETVIKSAGTVTFTLTGLDGTKEYDVYFSVQDGAGNTAEYLVNLPVYEATHELTFDLNGAAGTAPDKRTATDDVEILLPDGVTGITAPGTDSVFAGWDTQRDGTGVRYVPEAEKTFSFAGSAPTLTLYAQWLDLDAVIADGIRAVNQVIEDGATAPGGSGGMYAVLDPNWNRTANEVDVRIDDRSVTVSKVYTDIINTLLEKLNAQKDYLKAITTGEGGQTATLTLDGNPLSAQAIKEFVKASGLKNEKNEPLSGGEKLGVLPGQSLSATIHGKDGRTVTYTVHFVWPKVDEARIDEIITQGIKDVNQIIQADKGYAELSSLGSGNAVTVKILKGDVTVTQVYTDIILTLTQALKSNYSAVSTIKIGNAPATDIGDGLDIKALVKESGLKDGQGNNVSGTTPISDLHGQHVAVVVTAVGNQVAPTYTVNFALPSIPEFIAAHLDSVNAELKDGDAPYAELIVPAPGEAEAGVTVSILDKTQQNAKVAAAVKAVIGLVSDYSGIGSYRVVTKAAEGGKSTEFGPKPSLEAGVPMDVVTAVCEALKLDTAAMAGGTLAQFLDAMAANHLYTLDVVAYSDASCQTPVYTFHFTFEDGAGPAD